VPVFVMPGARLEDIERAAVALGVLTNHAAAGRALALKLRRQRQDVSHRLAGVAPLDVYVDAGFGASIPRTTLLARLLQMAGARLVGPSNGVTTANARLLHRLDPDAYIATSASGVTLARLRAQPRLRTLRALTAGRFFVVDADAARADTTAYTLLRSLAHSLHPTVVKQ
jgi:ABC-type Fe3+-hydroxamate transport system substrate-binding protein